MNSADGDNLLSSKFAVRGGVVRGEPIRPIAVTLRTRSPVHGIGRVFDRPSTLLPAVAYQAPCPVNVGSATKSSSQAIGRGLQPIPPSKGGR